MRERPWIRATLTWLRYVAVGTTFALGVVVLMLWLSGRFGPKVKVTGAAEEPAGRPASPAGSRVAARLVTIPVNESAVGSIRAVHETAVAAKLLAKVLEVNVRAGKQVTRGEVLVRLDDTDLRARLQQAQAAVSSAEAALDQAASEERRLADLVKKSAVSQIEYDRTVTARRTAEAELRRAKEAVNEAQAVLDYATVRAPMDGTVVEKQVDVGDTVTPGKVLLTLYDPSRMQLVASVRESLAHQLRVGQGVGVRVDVLDKTCDGQISEIVPEAQSASRTFQVKVTGPCPPGIYSGMFGRILIPLDEEEVLVIPRAAVRHVGQLELVDVFVGGRVQRRAIRTGRSVGADCQVLSGLKSGEEVMLPIDGDKSGNGA